MTNLFWYEGGWHILIIKNLNVNKAHGWDQLSIRMIKACGKSISFLLKLIFKSMINEDVFPENWRLFQFIKKNQEISLRTIGL